MGRTTSKRLGEDGHGREGRLSIRSVRREVPDQKKLAPVLLAVAQAEADAEAQHEREAAKRNRAAQPKDVA
jgi:hypothetical protein